MRQIDIVLQWQLEVKGFLCRGLVLKRRIAKQVLQVMIVQGKTML
jgi:hypothetical protein